MSKYNCELKLEDRNSLSTLLSRVKQNSIVLEFGPANGRMTKYMKEQLNCKVYAVEIDENAAKDSKQYTEKIVVDSIENYCWIDEFKDIKFDYVIFADVLEHLYYPEKVLKSIKSFLKDDGSILVSIPNIAHNAIVIGLLNNEFNYGPTGLLDDTHIRFYTKKTFENLIKKCEYYRFYETAIFMVPENTEFGYKYTQLPESVADYIVKQPYGEVYQLIYELKNYPVNTESDFQEGYKNGINKFIQLFIEDENPISEDNSIKIPVVESNQIQIFKFDLASKQNLKNLRLDPVNDCCIIEIESISLIKADGQEFDLIPYIQAEGYICHGKSYVFDSEDPQIYFDYINVQELKEIKSVVVSINYKYIGQNALRVSAKQIKLDLDNTKIELDSTKTELDSTKTELINIRNTLSWKMTKPIRFLKKLIKG